MAETNANVPIYHQRVLHSDEYYAAVLRILIQGCRAKLSDKELADSLNQKGLLSPRGKAWTSSAVKQALWKIRNFRESPNTLHRVLMQLAFSQLISGTDALVLFESRRGRTM